MNLLKLRIFQTGAVKQTKFLLSTPQNAQHCIYWPDSRTLSKEILSAKTSWLKPSSPDIKKSWLLIHPLEFKLKKEGELIQNESVLLITDRRYTPADPFVLIKSKDREKMTSLREIAKMRHAQVRADIGKKYDALTNTITLAIYGGVILGIIMLVINFAKECGNG